MNSKELENLRVKFNEQHALITEKLKEMVHKVTGDKEFIEINDDGAINMLFDMLDAKQKKIIDYIHERQSWGSDFFRNEINAPFFVTVNNKDKFDQVMDIQNGPERFVFVAFTLMDAYEKAFKDIEFFITNGMQLVKMAKLHKYVNQYTK
jgi:hypothetical protein